MTEPILISTGSVPWHYEILDAIFALDSHAAGVFTASNPARAFSGVKEQLRNQCRSMRGNAVINCQFEYRVALADGLFGQKQCVEIFAYGTALLRSVSPAVGRPSAPPPIPPRPRPQEPTLSCPMCEEPIELSHVRVGRNTCPHCGQHFDAE